MSASILRSISDGISQIFDDAVSICNNGYRDIQSESQSLASQTAAVSRSAGRITGRAVQQAASFVRSNPAQAALETAGVVFMPFALPRVAAYMGRRVVQWATSPQSRNDLQKWNRQIESAGIGRPLTASPEAINYLWASLQELLGFGPRNILFSPGGTEHLNPTLHTLYRTNSNPVELAHTYHRVNGASIGVEHFHRVQSPGVAAALAARGLLGGGAPNNANMNVGSETATPANSSSAGQAND